MPSIRTSPEHHNPNSTYCGSNNLAAAKSAGLHPKRIWSKRESIAAFVVLYVGLTAIVGWYFLSNIKLRAISPFSGERLVFADSLFAFIIIAVVVLVVQLGNLAINKKPPSVIEAAFRAIYSTCFTVILWLAPYLFVAYPFITVCAMIASLLAVSVFFIYEYRRKGEGAIQLTLSLITGIVWVAGCVASVCLFVIFTSGFPALSGSTSKYQVSDSDSFSEHVYWMLNQGWDDAELKKKLDDLQNVVSFESAELNVIEPTIVAGLLPDGVSAQYNKDSNIIKVDIQYLLKKDAHALLKSTEHEMGHVYQHAVISNAPYTESSRMRLSDEDVAQIDKELNDSYISDVDRGYAFQICELKANEFAETSVDELFSRARQWSLDNRIS